MSEVDRTFTNPADRQLLTEYCMQCRNETAGHSKCDTHHINYRMNSLLGLIKMRKRNGADTGIPALEGFSPKTNRLVNNKKVS